MGLIVAALLLLGALVIAVVVGMALLQLVGLAITGLVIGAVARLVLPGEQSIGWLGTILAGVAGSFLGGIVANVLDFGAILRFVLGVAAAAALIAAFAGSERAARSS